MNDDRERDPHGPDDADAERDLAPAEPTDAASDPMALLRAADPAASVRPREGFAADVVAEVLARDAGAPAVDGDTEETVVATGGDAAAAPVTDLGAERARRRPRWIAVAAVAASLAIVGGAGYAAGAGLNGTSTL